MSSISLFVRSVETGTPRVRMSIFHLADSRKKQAVDSPQTLPPVTFRTAQNGPEPTSVFRRLRWKLTGLQLWDERLWLCSHRRFIGPRVARPLSGLSMVKRVGPLRNRRSQVTKVKSTAHAPREGTKKARLVELLGRTKGASLVELATSTNWQSHTVRAAITDLKKRGYQIVREKIDAESRYRIAG